MQFNMLKEARNETGSYITYAKHKASRGKNVCSVMLKTGRTCIRHTKEIGFHPRAPTALKASLIRCPKAPCVSVTVLREQNKGVLLGASSPLRGEVNNHPDK